MYVTGIWHQGATVAGCLADLGNGCGDTDAVRFEAARSLVYEPQPRARRGADVVAVASERSGEESIGGFGLYPGPVSARHRSDARVHELSVAVGCSESASFVQKCCATRTAQSLAGRATPRRDRLEERA